MSMLKTATDALAWIESFGPSYTYPTRIARDTLAGMKADGWCPSRDDETHCVHWWDGEEACCGCGFDLPAPQEQAGQEAREEPDTEEV